MEVRHRREDLAKSKKKIIRCVYEKDEQQHTVVRERADPEALKKFLKIEFKNTGPKLAADLEWLRAAWPKLVGADVGEETEGFAFKNGVVTIAVYDHALLQEIRQFHKSTILQDLRDIWQASVPLVDIAYRVGVKKE